MGSGRRPVKQVSLKAGKAIKKVEGGKLVRVDTLFDTQLVQVTITGDFFLYPEEALVEIEKALKGASLPLERTNLISMVQKIVEDLNATLVGFSPEDLVAILEEAVR
jgi:lipoate---protein ligase